MNLQNNNQKHNEPNLNTKNNNCLNPGNYKNNDYTYANDDILNTFNDCYDNQENNNYSFFFENDNNIHLNDFAKIE